MRLFNRQTGRQSGRQSGRSSEIMGPETERYIPLDSEIMLAQPYSGKGRLYGLYGSTPLYGRRAGGREDGYRRSPGQALLIVALMMTVLVLFVGLGVDVGNLMGKRAKLQSAVDASALSAAQLLDNAVVLTSTVTTKAYQMLEANGVPSNTLQSKQVDVYTALNQVHVHAVQKVDTFFMRIIPAWRQVPVSADATADLNSFAEINIKPYGIPGVVNELNISIWGPDSGRTGGDAYSPQYIGSPMSNVTNPEHAKMPYGYLYRIDVPANFPDNHLLVQIFDPDNYNNPNPPPTPWTPAPSSTTRPGTATSTTVPSPTYYPNDGRFTYDSANPTGERFNTYLNLTAYPVNLTTTPVPTVWAGRKRVSFWRVDELRRDQANAGGIGPNPGEWSNAWQDTTTYTLWHFDPHITSAFGDPATLSDLSGGASIASYTVGADPTTDLAWYQPNGFDVSLSDPSCTGLNNDCYARESNGNMYFYIYVSTSAGSSENNFDIRVGPKTTNRNAGYTCDNLSSPNTNICFANTQYFKQTNSVSPPPDWDNGGGAPAVVFAKRAMPLNLDSGDHYPMLFTQVSKNAAGQTLAIRHFDQDCTGGCGPGNTMQYQMQKCVLTANITQNCPGDGSPCEPYPNLLQNAGYDPQPGNAQNQWVGHVGPGNDWLCPSGYPNNGCPGGWTETTDKVQIPVEGSADYNEFFGPNGECASSWLRLYSDPSYSQDTTVWEMPFARPRLIR